MTPPSSGAGVSGFNSGPKQFIRRTSGASFSAARTSGCSCAVSLETALRHGALRLDATPDALTRVYLALFQGFILQQAWEPGLEVGPYLQAVHAIIDAAIP